MVSAVSSSELLIELLVKLRSGADWQRLPEPVRDIALSKARAYDPSHAEQFAYLELDRALREEKSLLSLELANLVIELREVLVQERFEERRAIAGSVSFNISRAEVSRRIAEVSRKIFVSGFQYLGAC